MKRTSGIRRLKQIRPVLRSGLWHVCVCSCVWGCSDSGGGYQESSVDGANATPTTSTATTTSAATTTSVTAVTSGGQNTTAAAGGSGANGQSDTNGQSDASSSLGTTGEPAGGSGGSGGSAGDGGSGASGGAGGGSSGGGSSGSGAGGSSGSGGSASGAGGAGGLTTAATSAETTGTTDPGDGVPGIIAVGYGGLRIVTRDLGESWDNETHWSEDGGDDHDLLRTIAYGNGVWVSGGWRLVTSEDGVIWTDHGDAEDVIDAVNCPVTDGMAFGKGKFLVACGSTLAASTDGLSWERVGPTPDVGGHPHLVFDDATDQFACSGDDGVSFVSSDGEDWDEIEVESVRLCDGLESEDDCPSFYHDGVYLSTEWGGWIRRSTTGEDFMTTYSDPFGNNLFTEYSFAVGRVAP
ncbi:MAG TPA: hypothetical protein VI197_24740 [Polyangiaceae bacterium]